jgi:hypothetical protein
LAGRPIKKIIDLPKVVVVDLEIKVTMFTWKGHDHIISITISKSDTPLQPVHSKGIAVGGASGLTLRHQHDDYLREVGL